MRLSILDQVIVREGSTPRQAVSDSMELARRADELGYERFWFAEHHLQGVFASPSPEILIASAAAYTRKMRIGSGGVLLARYAPEKVAENFRLLGGLFPGRIDLGIGRSYGTPSLGKFDPNATKFDDHLTALIALLGSDPYTTSPQLDHDSVSQNSVPSTWLLGSSLKSSSLAAKLGLPYAFAHFISPSMTRAAIQNYLDTFIPGPNQPVPKVILAVGCICADTDAEAAELALSALYFQRRLNAGVPAPLPAPRDAGRQLSEPFPSVLSNSLITSPYVIGSAERVARVLRPFAFAAKVTEIMLLSGIYDNAANIRSYELMANIFGLSLA